MKDDQKRGRMGVVTSVVTRPRGRVRIVFDDVGSSTANWKTLQLYTWKDMSRRVFRGLKLTEKQLAEIGFVLVVRLLALETNSPSQARKPKEKTPGRRSP